MTAVCGDSIQLEVVPNSQTLVFIFPSNNNFVVYPDPFRNDSQSGGMNSFQLYVIERVCRRNRHPPLLSAILISQSHVRWKKSETLCHAESNVSRVPISNTIEQRRTNYDAFDTDCIISLVQIWLNERDENDGLTKRTRGSVVCGVLNAAEVELRLRLRLWLGCWDSEECLNKCLAYLCGGYDFDWNCCCLTQIRFCNKFNSLR